MWLYKINEFGHYVPGGDIEFVGKEIPEGYVAEPPISAYKPKWTGTDWVEGATTEEIDLINITQPQPPTDIEILQRQNAQMLFSSAQQTHIIEQLQRQNASIIFQLAQLQNGGAS